MTEEMIQKETIREIKEMIPEKNILSHTKNLTISLINLKKILEVRKNIKNFLLIK